jgi:hypothetical protein
MSCVSCCVVSLRCPTLAGNTSDVSALNEAREVRVLLLRVTVEFGYAINEANKSAGRK